MFAFRLSCSVAALLALVLAAPHLRGSRVAASPETVRAVSDGPRPHPIQQPSPDCPPFWSLPTSTTQAP